MEQLHTVIEAASSDGPEDQPKGSEVCHEDVAHIDPAENHGIRFGDEGGRLREQVCALQEQLSSLKNVILESGDNLTNLHDGQTDASTRTIQQQVSDRQVLSEVTTQRDSYYRRVKNLEERVGRLLSSGSIGGHENLRDILDQPSVVMVDPNLYYEMHREGGYLSQLEKDAMRMRSDHESTESEILVKLDAAKAEKVMVEADRDALIDENEDLRENLKKVLLRYEALIQQRKYVRRDINKPEEQVDALESQNVVTAEPDRRNEGGERKQLEELHHGQHLNTTHPKQSMRASEVFEAQLSLVRSERDAAVKQSEEARRNLATRTAERNGAHQRIRIIEASLKESQEREVKLQAENRKKQTLERAQSNLLDTEISAEDAERKEVEFLQEELEHAVAAASKAQHERDAARLELKVLEAENAIAHSAAETANDVVTELQTSLEAANNAALAEREKSEECRRTQNRLRIERETLRIEVKKLEKALSEAHQVSMGLVRHGNITVGDLVHIREEKDAALARIGMLQIELDKAHGTANKLQMALDDSLARQSFNPTDDLALEELNRVIAQRDEALAHVKELERLLEELEDDYRTNLDEWEQQTQKDEQAIIEYRDGMLEEKRRSTRLSDQLSSANSKLQDAETRAATAESRSTSLAIQVQQIGQDLDNSKGGREELEAASELLRAECLRLGGIIIAVRNEVVRLGGQRVAPDGPVQGEDGWPNGPPSPSPQPSDVSRSPTSARKPSRQHSNTEDHNPVPDPNQKATSSNRRPRRISSVYESSSSELSSVENEALIHHEPHVQWRPRQKSARRSDSQPPLRTSPTTSAITHPRSSRNPDPYYGASTRTRLIKRRADSDHENPGPTKKKRVKL
ncbi:hypothetical protein ONS96_014871 [Cadophora gregata f. sp. sojae]|nr:hypothetical protein ONS96_014871 [Cadophora gregata f. sp. sojae]